MRRSRLFPLVFFLITGQANASKFPTSADHVNLNSEHVLLDALTARLDQAVTLSRRAADLSSGPAKRNVEREMRRHAEQARWARERLQKWYRTKPKLRFEALPARNDLEYLASLRRNHAEIGELIEFSQGLSIRPELLRVLGAQSADCLVLSDSTSQSSPLPRAKAR